MFVVGVKIILTLLLRVDEHANYELVAMSSIYGVGHYIKYDI